MPVCVESVDTEQCMIGNLQPFVKTETSRYPSSQATCSQLFHVLCKSDAVLLPQTPQSSPVRWPSLYPISVWRYRELPGEP